MTRPHDHSSFYKYMPAGTAAAALERRTMRWSSPILFNDPFDVPRELVFDTTIEEIHAALCDLFARLIENPPRDKSHLQPKIQLILESIENAENCEIRDEMIAGIQEVQSTFSSDGTNLETLRKFWKDLIPEFRILCLTTNPTSASMWYHYANQYKGVVLEVQCLEEVDSAWFAARPVTYPTEKPEVYTPTGWAELLMMPTRNAVETILDLATFTKSPDWSYENEWRITSFKRPTDVGPFTDYKFSPKELAGIFLGPMISTEDRTIIVGLAKGYPSVAIYEMKIGMSRDFVVKKIDG